MRLRGRINDVTGVTHQVRTIFYEPFDTSKELGMGLQIPSIQYFDRKQGNKAYPRTQAQFVKFPIGKTQDVIEETFFLIPQLVITASHVLHGYADVHKMFKELYRQQLVSTIRLCEFQCDPHQVQAEESHPTGAIRLLEDGSAGQGLAAGQHRNIVQPKKSTLEDIIPLAIHAVDPPAEIDQQLVQAS